MKGDKLNAWPSVKLRESYSEVEQKDEERKSIVQQILDKSTDFLRRVTVPVEGQGAVTLSYVCPRCHRYPLEDCIWRSRQGTAMSTRRRGSATGAVLHVAAGTTGGIRTESW